MHTGSRCVPCWELTMPVFFICLWTFQRLSTQFCFCFVGKYKTLSLHFKLFLLDKLLKWRARWEIYTKIKSCQNPVIAATLVEAAAAPVMIGRSYSALIPPWQVQLLKCQICSGVTWNTWNPVPVIECLQHYSYTVLEILMIATSAGRLDEYIGCFIGLFYALYFVN